jgi:hypothetical protein
VSLVWKTIEVLLRSLSHICILRDCCGSSCKLYIITQLESVWSKVNTYCQYLLVLLVNPKAIPWSSHLIQSTVEQVRPQVTQKLHMARSKISFSFDAWSSRSHLPFLGIYAHFIDEDHRLATCLLGLKHLKGRHTGENMGDVLAQVIQSYDLSNKIGWFVCDNASCNDTTLRRLGEHINIELPEM